MGDAGAVTDPGNPDALLPSLDPRMFVTTSGAGTEKNSMYRMRSIWTVWPIYDMFNTLVLQLGTSGGLSLHT